MSVILDAGAFLAVERNDRHISALLKRERLAGRSPRTHGGVIGQVWRGGGRRALIAGLLKGCEVLPLDLVLGRKAGALLARAGTEDVNDAALVLLASDQDQVVTSDPDDLRKLAAAAGVDVDLIRA